ncbi:MAG TPA: CYTH domain-containing protein, partial [Parvularculaceae bacterium]|nr:CYTH domain-containing protein [Parvularculaceae bacterium]
MAQWREELEIKLKGAPADIVALRRSGLFEALGAGPPVVERLDSTYYDTSDRAIAAAGASLRLRKEAGGLVQAVKSKCDGGGVVSRAEEEQALASEAEFPAPFDGGALMALVDERGGISPVARTVADRWTLVVKKSGARIEVAFDLGRAEAWRDGGPAAFGTLAEAELELVDGRPDGLFDVARLCLKEGAGRLRLAGASKEEEARRLIEGGPWLQPEPALRLNARASAGDALAAALMSTALRLIDVAPAVTELRLAEGAHQMRVALRRLR